jgi:purine-nucleoside phosphorylase
MENDFEKIAAFLLQKKISKPQIGIILGSGLGALVEKMTIEYEIPYSSIPGFPISTVEGHAGRLLFGTIATKNVVVMQGRFHYYEGYEMSQIVLPVKVMKALGIEYLFVSNASGGLNPLFKTGDLMVITDHINFFPLNPLRGPNNDKDGPRFPDMSNVYDKRLIAKAFDIAKTDSIPLQKGIYIGSSGPTLETPAEYRMFRLLGADATGMSTVPEVIVAHHMGIKVFGVSVITNESECAEEIITTHEDVQTNAAAAEPRMTTIFTKLIASL